MVRETGRPPGRRSRAELLAACATVGRDPATLDQTVGLEVRYPDLIDRAERRRRSRGGAERHAAEAIADGLREHEALGARHLIADLEPTTPEAVQRLAAAVRLARSSPVSA